MTRLPTAAGAALCALALTGCQILAPVADSTDEAVAARFDAAYYAGTLEKFLRDVNRHTELVDISAKAAEE